MITDDFAYDDYHTYVSSDDEEVDSKGRKHKVHIYQDYRTIDGYSVDDGFDYNEVMYRNDYDYYIDKNKDYSILIKRNKETGEYYIFAITVDGNELVKEWYLPNNYSPDMKKIVLNYKFDDNKKVKDIKDVLNYINDDYYEIGKQLKEEGYNINCD